MNNEKVGAHTQGAWILSKGHAAVINGKGGCMIAECDLFINEGIMPFKTAKANARLIAAAPEMLVALKFSKEMLKHISPENQGFKNISLKIESAIAKAEGK